MRSCGPQTPVQKKPETAQLYTQLLNTNIDQREQDASLIFQKYQSALSDDLDAEQQLLKLGKITPQQYSQDEALKTANTIKGAILVADAKLRGAEITHNYNKYFLAYTTLQSYELHDSTNPAWTTQTISIPRKNGVAKVMTGHELYIQVVKELSAQNRTSLVWGFIPGYRFMDFLIRMTGSVPAFSYWFSALLLAFIVRGVVYPLTQKQLMFSRQMQQLIPRTREIKKQFPDMTTQQQKIMELYKEYGINPLQGCLPLLIQSPFFFAIYECMLRYRFEYQKGTFLWINPHMSALTHGFLAPNLGQQDDIMIVIYGVTMATTQFLMPIGDPDQAKQQRIMGILMSIAIPGFMLFGAFPVAGAFVLYWTFTNILATAQSVRAYRMPAPALEKVQTVYGGQIAQTGRKTGFMDKMRNQMQASYEEQLAKKEAEKNAAAGKPNPKPDTAKSNGNIWQAMQDQAKRQLEVQEQKGVKTSKDSVETVGQQEILKPTNGAAHLNGSTGTPKSLPKKKPKNKPKRRP